MKVSGKVNSPWKVNKSLHIVRVAKTTDKTTDKSKKRAPYFAPVLTTQPECVQTMFEKYSKQRPGNCACNLPVRKLNQGTFSKTGTPDHGNAMFKDVAEGDGSFKIGLSERASIKLDLGFLSNTKSKSADLSPADDYSTGADPDLSVGVMFGLR